MDNPVLTKGSFEYCLLRF